MVRHSTPPIETVRVIITPESERASVRLSNAAKGMVGQLANIYSQKAGHRISASNVIHILAENALQEMGVQ